MHVEKVMTWQRLEGFSRRGQEYEAEMDIRVGVVSRTEGDRTTSKG